MTPEDLRNLPYVIPQFIGIAFVLAVVLGWCVGLGA